MPSGPDGFVTNPAYGREFTKARELVLAHPGRWRIIYHYDGDGIASASTLVRMFERLGYPPYATPLQGVEREKMRAILDGTHGPVLVVDTGASWLDLYPAHAHPVVILDHHQYRGRPAPPDLPAHVAFVNPVDWGVDGMREMCAATLSWLFSVFLDPVNWDNAAWGLSGRNRRPPARRRVLRPQRDARRRGGPALARHPPLRSCPLRPDPRGGGRPLDRPVPEGALRPARRGPRVPGAARPRPEARDRLARLERRADAPPGAPRPARPAGGAGGVLRDPEAGAVPPPLARRRCRGTFQLAERPRARRCGPDRRRPRPRGSETPGRPGARPRRRGVRRSSPGCGASRTVGLTHSPRSSGSRAPRRRTRGRRQVSR